MIVVVVVIDSLVGTLLSLWSRALTIEMRHFATAVANVAFGRKQSDEKPKSVNFGVFLLTIRKNATANCPSKSMRAHFTSTKIPAKIQKKKSNGKPKIMY